jgi:hypothetical protein
MAVTLLPARRDMERVSLHLPDRDLGLTFEAARSISTTMWPQSIGRGVRRANREVMMDRARSARTLRVPNFSVSGAAVNCHHNYVERERISAQVWIRAGAIRAGAGVGIIRAAWVPSPILCAARARRQFRIVRAWRWPPHEPRRSKRRYTAGRI